MDELWHRPAIRDLAKRRSAPGPHLVQAHGQSSASPCVRVEITDGERSSIELELLPARRVHLQVRENGALVGSELTVVDSSGRDQRVQTRENDEAWVGLLVLGRYTVRAQRGAKHVERIFEVSAGEGPLKIELVFE